MKKAAAEIRKFKIISTIVPVVTGDVDRTGHAIMWVLIEHFPSKARRFEAFWGIVKQRPIIGLTVGEPLERRLLAERLETSIRVVDLGVKATHAEAKRWFPNITTTNYRS